MKRRVLALFLVLALSLCLAPANAFAEYNPPTAEPAGINAVSYIYFKDASGNPYRVNRYINVTTGSSYTGYVLVIQDLMNMFYYVTANSAYYVGTPDGIFGSNTYGAVTTFQANMGLYPVDGIVGYGTWTELHTRWQNDLGSRNLPDV